MKKKIIKTLLGFLLGLLLLLTAVFVFVLWDNHRIAVVGEEVKISDLPTELEGFTILQISDLHEREFGKNQKRLLKKINAADYDVLVFTGDMLNDPDSTNTEGFYTLLDGIENKDHILYVQGNTDPANYKVTDTLEKSEFIQAIEERGVKFLESYETILVEGVPIHFVNFELAIIKDPDQIGQTNGIVRDIHAGDPQYQKYQAKLWREMIVKGIFEADDTLIALNHYPVPDPRVDFIEMDEHTGMRNFDLMIAGHYHGGQIRIPFLGAPFIPDPWYEPNSFWPPQDRVKGLWEYNGYQQYVSAGLGNSESVPFLAFRLFNPPEINIIKLTKQ